VLLGMSRPVHVLQRGVEVADIVNMAALCVLDAQESERGSIPLCASVNPLRWRIVP
jgi:hypothetical protein